MAAVTDTYFAAGEIGDEGSVRAVAELSAARRAGLRLGFGTQQCWAGRRGQGVSASMAALSRAAPGAVARVRYAAVLVTGDVWAEQWRQ